MTSAEDLDPADLATIETREQARDYAINWQHWFSERDSYMSEVADWGSAFEALAEKFDLTDEFRENGII